MCSSESEADPSSEPGSLPGPALRNRKRSGDSSFIEDRDNNNHPDSDDDFVIVKKKKKVEKKKRKASTAKGKKSSQGMNISNTSKSSSVSDVSLSSPPDAEKSNLTIEVMLKKEETSNHEGFINNLGVSRPVTIATPDQINNRGFDQEDMTPSSCSTPVEENIVQKLVEQVPQVQPPVNPKLKTSEELNMKTLPKPCSSTPQQADSTTRLPLLPGQSQVANANPIMPVGRGRGSRPAPPSRPGQARQTTPGTRPPIRPSGPRMLRPARPNLPPRYAAYRPSQAVTRPGLITGGSRLPNIRPSNPIKYRSLSAPQYSSQYNPPVIELDVSPPRSADLVSQPPTNSVINKLTSMGLSVAMEKVPTAKHGWVLPPGLSVTRTPSSTVEEDPSTTLPSLAKALLQLGEVQGSKRLVQFKLTESQVSALQALGVREELG